MINKRKKWKPPHKVNSRESGVKKKVSTNVEVEWGWMPSKININNKGRRKGDTGKVASVSKFNFLLKSNRSLAGKGHW